MGKTNLESSSPDDVCVSVEDAANSGEPTLFVDVRKPKARMASGQTIPGSQFCHPFDALNWKESVRGKKVIVFCVHGHEVSQSVCGYLRDEGIGARYLEGGFEAWLEAGYPVTGIETGGE